MYFSKTFFFQLQVLRQFSIIRVVVPNIVSMKLAKLDWFKVTCSEVLGSEVKLLWFCVISILKSSLNIVLRSSLITIVLRSSLNIVLRSWAHSFDIFPKHHCFEIIHKHIVVLRWSLNTLFCDDPWTHYCFEINPKHQHCFEFIPECVVVSPD